MLFSDMKNCAKVLIVIDTNCHSGIAQGVIHNLKVGSNTEFWAKLFFRIYYITALHI
jgi:hypothetical protein